jgi:hypothetical protein
LGDWNANCVWLKSAVQDCVWWNPINPWLVNNPKSKDLFMGTA